MEADHDVTIKAIDARGLTEAIDVIGCGAGDLLKHGDAARDHVAIPEIADPQHAIDAFADQIDQPVAFADKEFDIRIFGEEVRQARQHKITRERAANINAHYSLRLGAPKDSLGL